MNMNDKLKETFDLIHAEEDLKDKTKAFLAKETHGYKKSKHFGIQKLIPVAVCFLLLLIGWGGYHIYFTPTSTISIDINPSLELGVNRFDKVISVKGYNEDGEQLASSLSVNNMDYKNAVEEIMENTSIAEYLSQDEIISIAVVGDDQEQSERIVSSMRLYTSDQSNAYCYAADTEEVALAHEVGLSYGKYKAFLEVQALDPEITPEQIQEMSMREIRDLLNTLSNAGSNGPNEQDKTGHWGAGKNHGYGHGKKNRKGESE